MRTSLAAIVAFITMFVVGCSQMGQSPSATAPSAVSQLGSSSELLSGKSGSGASYDATGSWRVLIRQTPDGPVINEEDVDFTQDPSGVIHSSDGATLTPVSVGRTAVLYSVAVLEPHEACDTFLSGRVKIHTTDNTLLGYLSGIEAEEGCSRVDFYVTATRN